MNTNNIRRTIDLPAARTEKKSEVNVTTGSFPGPEAADMPARLPRCVKACSSRRSRGWRRSGRNRAA